MTTNYLNLDHYPISQAQLSQIEGYVVEELDADNEQKTLKWYHNNVFTQIRYYLDASEDPAVIRSQYPDVFLTFFKNRVIQGQYRKYDVEVVDFFGIVELKFVEVYNDHPLPIYQKIIDVNTNLPIFLEKYYYDVNDIVNYEFHYDPLTNAFKDVFARDLYGTFDSMNPRIRPADVGVNNNDFNFSWLGFEYYQDGLPIIPSTPIG